MQLGMIGQGRMGGSMVQRLLKGGHQCVVFDASTARVAAAVDTGASGAQSLKELLARLDAPRVVWLMVPADVVDAVLEELSGELQAGDIVVDGGNTHYIDDIRRARVLSARGVHYVDVGVSGGIWGLDRGYCLMIGGDLSTVDHLDPIFRILAPGIEAGAPAQDRGDSFRTAEQGYLYCGPAGAGHFVKMVHNGIEYALMVAYAEGFNLLAHANAGATDASVDTTPLRDREHFRYAFALPEIAEVWRHGSVIGSWLLDLTATALAGDPALKQFAGRVSDHSRTRSPTRTVFASIISSARKRCRTFCTSASPTRFSSRSGIEDMWSACRSR